MQRSWSMTCGSRRVPVMHSTGQFRRTDRAAHALSDDFVVDQAPRSAGRAALLGDVGQVFVAEVRQRAEDRIGAARPSPQSEDFLISRASRFSLSMSSIVALPAVMRSRISIIRSVPSRQGVHLPHDSSCEKVMKNLAISTMQSSSSRTIMPPLPMIEPALAERVVVDRRSIALCGNAAAGRAAGLDRLELLAAGHAAADVVDDFAQGRAHRHFDQPGVAAPCRPGQRPWCRRFGRADRLNQSAPN